MRGERWQFNNQQAQERWWCNERGGDATTNQHERGAAQGERQWRDKRGEGWYGKGLHGQHDKRRCGTTASNLN